MIPILYENTETAFTSNGIHRLIDCISCTVVEERNGIYECDFEYSTNGQYFDEITCGRIIGVEHDESGGIQPFDIVSYSRPINGIVTFHAVHISYRQCALTVSGTNINSLADAFTMLGNAEPSNPFTYWTDKTSLGYLASGDGIPHTVRSILGGMEGSILDAYGGEYEWDTWTVKLWAARGSLKDFTIRYGANMTDYNEDTDYNDTYNSVIPYWVGQDANGDPLIIIGDRQSSGHSTFNGTDRCIPLDVTDKFDANDGTPTKAQVEAEGLAYLTANSPYLPAQTLKVDFLRLSDFPEYSQFEVLQKCKLCDTINVLFPQYNVSGTFKIVKTEYDVLRDRYESLELGTLSISLATALGINSSSSNHVSIGGGGGTSDYNDLSNKPSINGTTLSGNKTSANLSIHEVPSGGSTGQVLSKASGTNYDLAWVNQSGASVTDVQVNGTSVVSSGVANVPVSRETVYGVVKTAFNNDPSGGVVSITHHNSGGTETTGYAPLVQYLNGDYQPIRAKLLPDATTTTKGALSAADKTKLDKVILDANDKIDPSILPTANASDYGVVKVSYNPGYAEITYSNGSTVKLAAISSVDNTIAYWVLPDATTTYKGAMSATDKAIVDSIPNGGTSGQVLAKSSGTDYDFTWADNGVTDVKVYGTSVVSSGVANIPKMTGATSSTHGAVGVVPQPLSGEQAKFLFGDGTWDSIWASTANTGIDTFRIDITKYNGNYPSLTQIEIPTATTTKAGIMTSADRTKLDGLSVLPVGSVYESTSSTNPSTDLGNTWTLLGTTDLTSATAIGTSGGDDIVTSEGDTLGFGIVTYKFERTA